MMPYGYDVHPSSSQFPPIYSWNNGYPVPPQILPRLKSNHLARQSRASRTSPRLPSIGRKKKFFYIPHKIDSGFTSSEQIIIENALQIIAQRIFKPELLENVYRICGKSGYFLDSDVWDRSNLQSHRCVHGPLGLLEYQLTCLKIQAEKDQFPLIHISSFYEPTATSGSGLIGCISCISHRTHFTIEGEFQMKINRYHLNATNRDAADPVRWAGVIVHEILHNLGHRHAVGDYSDRWQINAFERSFIHDGRYFP